jgi:hypothetical protein
MCTQAGITVAGAGLWLLGVKAFQHYNRSTSVHQRRADKLVSRDHCHLRQAVSEGIGPDRLEHWFGDRRLDGSSRKQKDRRAANPNGILGARPGIWTRTGPKTLARIEAIPFDHPVLGLLYRRKPGYLELQQGVFDEELIATIMDTHIKTDKPD